MSCRTNRRNNHYDKQHSQGERKASDAEERLSIRGRPSKAHATQAIWRQRLPREPCNNCPRHRFPVRTANTEAFLRADRSKRLIDCAISRGSAGRTKKTARLNSAGPSSRFRSRFRVAKASSIVAVGVRCAKMQSEINLASKSRAADRIQIMRALNVKPRGPSIRAMRLSSCNLTIVRITSMRAMAVAPRPRYSCFGCAATSNRTRMPTDGSACSLQVTRHSISIVSLSAPHCARACAGG